MMPTRALLIAGWPQAIALEIADCTDTASFDEAALPEPLHRASPKRRREFVAGRACAKQALQRSGCVAIGELAIGGDRMPVWPGGFTGSISHSGGLAIAAAASGAEFVALGIDIQQRLAEERARALSAEIASDAEWSRLPADAASLAWCCKESFYKAWSKTIKGRIGFRDIEIVGFNAQAGFADLRSNNGTSSRVRFTTFGEHTLALCAIESAKPSCDTD